jgi:hypothetical protein
MAPVLPCIFRGRVPRETTMAEGGDMNEAQVAARAAKEMTR